MKYPLVLVLGALIAAPTFSATVPFSGPLRIVETDLIGIYSGTPLGTEFSGSIDDVSFDGSITDGTTETVIDCCVLELDELGISIENDRQLTVDDADFLNEIAEEQRFTAGMMVDLVDVEGDTPTAGSGRLEVGLSFILDSAAFPDDDPSNYPFAPDDVLLGLYFIVEEDIELGDVYEAYGRNDLAAIPLPGAAWLFVSACGLLGWLRNRQV